MTVTEHSHSVFVSDSYNNMIHRFKSADGEYTTSTCRNSTVRMLYVSRGMGAKSTYVIAIITAFRYSISTSNLCNDLAPKMS